MNEKEMIEEIQSILPYIEVIKAMYNDIDFARYLYDRNCRKIPEGSVVLDRQEHQKYCAYKIIEPQIRGCLDRERELERKLKELEEQRDRQAYITEELIQEKHRWTEQARKETAEKIYKLVDNKLDLYRNGVIGGTLYDSGYQTAISDIKQKIKDIYGVEVEE